MIQLMLKYPENTPNTRGYELLKSVLDLNGIENFESNTVGHNVDLVITDYFIHETPTRLGLDEAAQVTELGRWCNEKGIPILWFYPGESYYTEAAVYNPTGRFAATLEVPTYLIKSGDAMEVGNLDGYTQVFNLEFYHIYQVLNKFNLGRLHKTRNDMDTVVKDKKFLYLNGMARLHRQLLFEAINQTGLLDQAIWSWKDFKQGVDALGVDPEVNWQRERLLLNQFRYQGYFPEHYIRTEFSVVTETAMGEIFFSEKTAKCLILGHPFVLLGESGSLEKLRSWGYMTFSPIIDESYDKSHVYDSKIPLLVNEIFRLCTEPSIYEQCKTQTEHNMKHSLYLSSKIYSDLLDIILHAGGGRVTTDQKLSLVATNRIYQYMTDFASTK